MRVVLDTNLYIDQKGLVVTHEEFGVFPPWGCYRAAYMVGPDGNYTRDWYADHTCSFDTWQAPIAFNLIPEKVKVVLGKPIELVPHSELVALFGAYNTIYHILGVSV